MLNIIGLIPTVLTFLTGLSGTVGKVSDNIKELEIAKESTKSNKEKAIIDAQIQEAHDRKDVLVAEAGSRINAVIRACIAIGPGMYVFKYYAIDKVIGSIIGCRGDDMATYCSRFATDGLNAQMAVVLTAVIAFYFLYDLGKRK
jgi:hypothetical protein